MKALIFKKKFYVYLQKFTLFTKGSIYSIIIIRIILNTFGIYEILTFADIREITQH